MRVKVRFIYLAFVIFSSSAYSVVIFPGTERAFDSNERTLEFLEQLFSAIWETDPLNAERVASAIQRKEYLSERPQDGPRPSKRVGRFVPVGAPGYTVTIYDGRPRPVPQTPLTIDADHTLLAAMFSNSVVLNRFHY